VDNEFQFLLLDHKVDDHVHVEAHIVKIKLIIALQIAIRIFAHESSLEKYKTMKRITYKKNEFWQHFVNCLFTLVSFSFMKKFSRSEAAPTLKAYYMA